MDRQDAAERINKLREEIRRHNYLYYAQDAPEITDAEYDAIFRELLELENAYQELATPDSPTRRVGGEALDKFSQVTHTMPMLSLENAVDETEIRDFDDRV